MEKSVNTNTKKKKSIDNRKISDCLIYDKDCSELKTEQSE